MLPRYLTGGLLDFTGSRESEDNPRIVSNCPGQYNPEPIQCVQLSLLLLLLLLNLP